MNNLTDALSDPFKIAGCYAVTMAAALGIGSFVYYFLVVLKFTYVFAGDIGERMLSICFNNDPDNGLDAAHKVLQQCISVSYDDKYLDQFVRQENDFLFTSDELNDIRSGVLKKSDAINVKKIALGKCFIIEPTPRGNVVMTYNSADSQFEYYSDSSIPYRFLEVIARRYVVTFYCKPIFALPLTESTEATESTESTDPHHNTKVSDTTFQPIASSICVAKSPLPTVPAKPSVFAAFKSYNKSTVSGISKSTVSQIPYDVVKSDKTSDAIAAAATSVHNNPSIPINKYMCIGKIVDYNICNPCSNPDCDPTTITSKTRMSYKQFKLFRK